MFGKAAGGAGNPGEQVFHVQQSHIPKTKKDIQLKVGGMGVTLFEGPRMIKSYLYYDLKGWSVTLASIWPCAALAVKAAGCWLLALGCWLLPAGAGCLLLTAAGWLLVGSELVPDSRLSAGLFVGRTQRRKMCWCSK